MVKQAFLTALICKQAFMENQSLLGPTTSCLLWKIFLQCYLFRVVLADKSMKLRILIVYMFPLYSYRRCRVSFFLLGCLCGPVINSVFGRRCRKTVIRGREDTRVWYRETMFSQMVSQDFLLHETQHGYFLCLVSAPPEKPTRRCEPEEGYLRCSKRFDHSSHSIIFLLFEFKAVR